MNGWLKKHGTSRRPSWRKLHIGIDAESGEIVAIELTGKEIDDAARTGALLDQITDPVASFTADGANDQAIRRRPEDGLESLDLTPG